MKCDFCNSKMLEQKWKIDFLVEGRFVSVMNYPTYICIKCAKYMIKHRVNERVLEKLSEKSNGKPIIKAIKFEEIR